MSNGIGVLSFPGSNGDTDALHALTDGVGAPARVIDHRETDLSGMAAVVLPGGFSYGDHLRCGAIARFAPVMAPLRAFAARGGPVLGICNGFQILAEAHLLPGALLPNQTLRFHCFWTHVRFDGLPTAWTGALAAGEVLRLPVAHGEGAYFADDETLDRLESTGRIVARYCDPSGAVAAAANPNGSARGIAAVANEAGNVVGIMPHPERASDPLIGGADGLRLLQSALDFVHAAV